MYLDKETSYNKKGNNLIFAYQVLLIKWVVPNRLMLGTFILY